MKMRILIFGATGWIGSQMVDLFDEASVVTTNTRMESPMAEEVVREVHPTHVVCCAGLTGRPNVDWCEVHKHDVIRTNVIGVLNLADICHKRDIHFTYFGTGCIYDYTNDIDDLRVGNWKSGFKERDKPNFNRSFYSKTKVMVQELLNEYKNCLVLRLRMPITGDLEHPRNFITKIMGYERIVSVPNSMSVLPTLLPVAADMVKKSVTGTFNFTNPGFICHDDVMNMVKFYRKRDLTWNIMTLSEQSKILKAGRSNCVLDSTKLLELYPDIPDIHTALKNVLIL